MYITILKGICVLVMIYVVLRIIFLMVKRHGMGRVVEKGKIGWRRILGYGFLYLVWLASLVLQVLHYSGEDSWFLLCFGLVMMTYFVLRDLMSPTTIYENGFSEAMSCVRFDQIVYYKWFPNQSETTSTLVYQTKESLINRLIKNKKKTVTLRDELVDYVENKLIAPRKA